MTRLTGMWAGCAAAFLALAGIARAEDQARDTVGQVLVDLHTLQNQNPPIGPHLRNAVTATNDPLGPFTNGASDSLRQAMKTSDDSANSKENRV